ncbi:hypothetical protein ACEPAH_2913 [Sanghuangporus vaninii]
MGLILSTTTIQREDAQIEAAQAAIEAGRPLNEEGAGQYEDNNPDMLFGVGMTKSAKKKEKKEAKKEVKKKRKEQKKAIKAMKVRNVRHGRVDLLEGEDSNEART